MAQPHLLTFTETEASPHITKCLDYFFDDGGRNKYTFSSAYLKYSKFKNEPLITTKRLFNIVRSTNLIVNEKIFRHQTTSGFNYFIDKQFYGLAERYHRRISRRTTTPPPTSDISRKSTSSHTSPVRTNTPSNERAPTTKDGSIGSLLIGDTWEDDRTKSLQVPIEHVKTTPQPSDDTSEKSLPLLQQSPTQLHQKIENDVREEITKLVASEVSLQLKKYHDENPSSYDPNILTDLTKTHAFFQDFEEEYRQHADKLRSRMEWVNNNMVSYEQKFHERFDDGLEKLLTNATDVMNRKRTQFSTFVDETTTELNSKVAVLHNDCSKLADIIAKDKSNISNLQQSLLPSAHTLKGVTTQMKKLLKEYQTKVTILDSTVDIVNDELDNIKEDVTSAFKEQARSLLTEMQSNAAAVSNSIPVTPQKQQSSTTLFQNKWQTSVDTDPSPSPNHTFVPPSKPSVSSSPIQYQGVRTDILRKNVKISCQDETQLLDFYIKLRTAMIQAGIFLREINDINENEDIYEQRDGLTLSDYTVQANALYGFLCNEDVIPQDFTFAQNCIKSNSSTMDGFQTLKRMLILVHPLLNHRRPPTEPPLYSSTDDLHLYEQELRNFYLLHTIYGRSEYTDIDKSRQFLDGLDSDEYIAERTRLTAIIDAVELNNADLQTKHQINSLASTIMNMKNKNISSKVQINAFTKARTYKNSTVPYNSSTGNSRREFSHYRKNNHELTRGTGFAFKTTYDNESHKKISTRSPANSKFFKGQCTACKIYGHNIKDCRFIAPHIAMARFMKQNPQTCDEILSHHISSNTVEHKRTIVRTMQTMGFFDEDADSDTFLDDDNIVDTPVVNKIVTDLHNSEETASPDSAQQEYDRVQINMVSTTDIPPDLERIIPSLTTSSTAVSPVFIHSLDDMNLDKMTYDADMYDEDFAPTVLRQAITVPNNSSVPNLNVMSLEDINCFIDTLKQRENTQLKHFTRCDLNNHIRDHWRLKIRVQMDSGASDCITPDKKLLKHFKYVKPRGINTADVTSAGCKIEGEGFMDIQTASGDWISIKTLYVPNAAGTIVSPTFIAKNDPLFTSWNQMSHTDTGRAEIIFFNRYEYRPHITLHMYQLNNCWYLDQSYLDTVHRAKGKTMNYTVSDEDDTSSHTVVNTLSRQAEYEVWHQRLLHPGQTCMDHIHHCVDGIPSLKRHAFHTCPVCDHAKVTHNYNHNVEPLKATKVGEIFSMDFGFVKGNVDGRLVRSHDGYSSYVLVVDHRTRYTWVFLTKNKRPPIQMLNTFLKTYGLKSDGVKLIRTDQGGELARSQQFRDIIASNGYQLEITSADNSSQNGKAERPHRTLANMMRAGLENAGLHPKYWSDALLHSTFIKNRLPHSAFDFKSTPYTELTGVKPNLRHLKIFGSRITVRKTGKRVGKISSHYYNGIFLRYAKTMRNFVYIDTDTKNIKTSSHAIFDEAHYSQPTQPRGAQILMKHGMASSETKKTTPIRPPVKSVTSFTSEQCNNLIVSLSHPDAIIPKQATSKAAGYDLYSVDTTVIQPGCIERINTGIKVQLPLHTYGRIASRSGLALKYNITTEGGVIDPDFTGELQVLLHNCGTTPFTVNKGDRIAQLILERFESSPIQLVDSIAATTRGEQGFGSTGLQSIISHNSINSLQACDLTMSLSEPCDILDIQLDTNHPHPTLGLKLTDKLKLLSCIPGTPAAKIKGWRKTLQHTTLYAVNNNTVDSMDDIIRHLDKTKPSALFQFKTTFQPSVHPETGVTQISFDQFTAIANHHQQIREEARTENQIDPTQIDPPPTQHTFVHSLTRGKLVKQEDWAEWESAEKNQLDLYETQNMFSKPSKLPNEHGINVLAMIWVYLIKTCGRKKARCVANGNPKQKGSVTLANTYAACLEQAGARIFWATCALKNKVVYGADMSNAFAEAPAPKAPLYLKVDAAYKNWWYKKTGEQLDGDYYVKVQHAIQGHPESPRLWQLFIDKILTEIGFRATTHEPCVYKLQNDSFNEEVFLLRQVDDFALGCDSEETAEAIWKLIDSKMSAPLKREGLLRRFNGIDVVQSRDFIRIHCNTYISKIMAEKSFDLTITENKPTPMTSDNDKIRLLDTSVGPDNDADRLKLQQEMGFKYRAATGELLFAMVTCRPDISSAVIKLTQFNMNPAKCHYEAVIRVYQYLNATQHHGLTFWRVHQNTNMPIVPHQEPQPEDYIFQTTKEHNDPQLPYVLVDSDWGGNVKTRRSVSGIVIMMAGAAVIYKTILQRVIALSSTEAEFYALSEAGKLTLYVRSILNELGMPQHNATSMYEDNKGCLHMTQNQKPTKNTRHVDLRHFAVVDWVSQDLLAVKKICTSDNSSDTLTKSLGRTLFHRHTDTIMGNRRPTCVQ